MTTCARCGAVFYCGMANGIENEPCWCRQLPSLPAEALHLLTDGQPATTCFCPACLAAAARGSNPLPS